VPDGIDVSEYRAIVTKIPPGPTVVIPIPETNAITTNATIRTPSNGSPIIPLEGSPGSRIVPRGRLPVHPSGQASRTPVPVRPDRAWSVR